ncbi:serine/threonine protein kinase [Streptomyces anulatus]|uniref:serine/threonine-protein kinase n=1 Tax=Streptomyces anulatus TaxID=1892 RepID=UPI002254E55C|nr:serine/threonine-protein kinase [Streptomyces anulatus]MCX4488060.1 serine/threonine protein kinase [Streptomyces anulatus]WSI80879.1 serine/threonine protein kinase [Streptomyces anulatus]
MKPLGPSSPGAAGPYRLHAELGRGGMGRVLLGTGADGRIVAVKQVHARLAADEGFRTRFRREVAASRKVSGAFTAPVLDADPDAATPWLASAFVAGPSLGAAVAAAGALPPEDVRRLAAGLAAALTAIHRAGLVHRDLKPENVLLAEDGVRVIDFGIARVVDGAGGTALTQPGLVIGSPPFMSPEQAEGREPTASGDVFSLGSVLVLAATGRSPFAGASTAQSLYNVVHTEPDLTALPAELRRIVEPCLAKDPAARPTPAQLQEFVGPVAHSVRPWPSAVHRMIEDQRASIDRLLDGHEHTVVSAPPPPNALASAPTRTAVRPAPPAPPSGRPRTKVLAALVAAGVLALAGVGLGVYALTSGGGEPSDRRGGPSSGAAGDGASPAADPGDGGEPSKGAEARPDTYTKVPLCSEAAKNLPLRGRDEASDRYQESGDRASNACWWYGSHQEGGVGRRDESPHAFVEWDLKRSSSSSSGPTDNGTFFQRQIFDTRAKEGRPEPALGFGDAAYWRDLDNPAEDPGTTCSLNVLDGNLAVRVDLGGDEHPPARCEADARKIAAAAIAAMPG